MGQLKSGKQLERHFKGVANHYRIETLLLIADREGISLEEIAETLEASEKTIGEHSRRLVRAGLVNKTYRGRRVEHTTSPYGKIFVRFIKSFQQM